MNSTHLLLIGAAAMFGTVPAVVQAAPLSPPASPSSAAAASISTQTSMGASEAPTSGVQPPQAVDPLAAKNAPDPTGASTAPVTQQSSKSKNKSRKKPN